MANVTSEGAGASAWFQYGGNTFTPGKGGHLHVELNGKRSVLPMHGLHELGSGLVHTIKKQLGLKGK